ncbi:MAG: hypothetical protein ABJA70_03435 [Chryseolinea sp.]
MKKSLLGKTCTLGACLTYAHHADFVRRQIEVIIPDIVLISEVYLKSMELANCS